ncbi:MAG: hypothetical protein H0W19_07030 [Nitrosopumilus sp.]|nr:hypothetical protein [Nitrosopumilus sp.]
MKINPSLDRVAFVSVSFIILLSFILAFSSLQLTPEIYIHSQETNSSNNDEFLLSINQTYLSLIPLMIEEVQNTNASDIPIKQIMEATPSNATALQDIVKNNSNKTAQNEASATLNNSNPSRPQDLIPVIVNMTQNTNASDIPIKNVINTVPSNATALQDIVKNNSNKTAQNEASATLNNATLNNSNPSRPQDLIPVIVNMTQNTNASDLGFMRIINALPDYDNSESNNANFSK